MDIILKLICTLLFLLGLGVILYASVCEANTEAKLSRLRISYLKSLIHKHRKGEK